MKYLSFLFAFTWLHASYASAQDVHDVIKAEKAFAEYALKQNVRDAFLQFLDSNAVVFDKGEIFNAKQVWEGNTGFTGKLLWKPAFAGISLSGDLAFTTGPWEYKPSLADSSVASGEFATIWIKTKAGAWKFLLDLGVDLNQKMDMYKEVKIAGKGIKSVADSNQANQLEEQLNRQVVKDGAAALVSSAADDGWYIVNRQAPLQGIGEIGKHAVRITPAKLAFSPVEAKMAASGDLAYAYGYVTYDNTKENYLRVWQNTDKGWKVILLLIK